MHKVYIIRNDIDPLHIYIGTTTDPHKRFIKHCSSSSRCRRLRNAIKKVGREHFHLEVVVEFFQPSDAYAYEVELIKKMRSEGHKLYNLTGGGYGALGRTVRKRTREKLSAAMRKVSQREEPGVESRA